MSQHLGNHDLALAGLAFSLRDWWTGDLPVADRAVTQRAERLATGAGPASGGAPLALRSIFDGLRGYSGEAHYVPVGELDLGAQALYPQPTSATGGAFEALQGGFAAAVTTLAPEPNVQVRLESLLDALQRYAWCAPAPQYGVDSDVSLYDHARTTAALTVCLADPSSTDAETALLIGGDLSGVQDWLYTLGSSGAAKSLRGRSFYLQLLTDVIAFKVLDDLELPLTNLIYAGGGNFYVLAPVSAGTGFDELSRQISATLLDIHEGDLYLSMGCTAIRADEFAMGAIGAAWNRVNSALGRQKRQRFANLGANKMAEVVGAPLNQGGKPDKACSVCQRENPKGKPWPRDKDDENVRKCDLCASLQVLGNRLPDATHIVVSRLKASTKATHAIDDWQDGMHALGYHVEVVDGSTASADRHPEAINARIGRTMLPPDRVLDSQAGYAYAGLPHAFFYRPLVNIVPRNKNGEIATFDQLCNNAQGIDRWGVLRLDVDDLGMLFRDGFGKRATLTRTTQLSFALRLFFEGRLNAIGQRFNATSPSFDVDQPGAERGKDKVYAMYSGGDDLFIVGAWDALPHLARAVRDGFHQYVAQNPRLTLSGGISLVAERFPLYQAARQAGRAEERAKDFERDGGHDKDALAFLGQVFGWEQFSPIWERVAKLQAWSESGRINRSLIQTLRSIDGEYQAGLKRQQQLRATGKAGQAGQFYYGPWMWKLVYQLSRVAAQARRAGQEDVGAWVERLRDELIEPDGPITTLGLTARWAEYLTRKHKEA